MVRDWLNVSRELEVGRSGMFWDVYFGSGSRDVFLLEGAFPQKRGPGSKVLFG
jgi:hypothetical protein